MAGPDYKRLEKNIYYDPRYKKSWLVAAQRKGMKIHRQCASLREARLVRFEFFEGVNRAQ